MFEINGTLIIFVVSFLVYIKLIDMILIKPVSLAIEKRAAKIRGDIDSSKAAHAEAHSLLTNYQNRLKEVRSNAQEVINESVEKANYHRNLELTKIKDEGRKKLDEAISAIAQEKVVLIDGLVKQESELVASIATKLLGEEVNVKLDPIVVRRALEEVS